jgi:hypothetical protein
VQNFDLQESALVPVWPLTLILRSGEVLDLPVKAPLLRGALFRYKPAEGESVQSVAVAGDFNGCSDKNHPMKHVSEAEEWQLPLKLAAGHQQQTRDHCKRLLELRASSMALQYGSTHFLYDRDNVLLMSRRYLQEDCWVAINRSSMPAAVTVELKNIPQTALKLRDRPTSLSNLVVRASARYPCKGVYRLDIPPYSSAIWAHP